ncbi:MAG TPA: YigZ family protein [Clostridiaceae bacterium]|nr:YigZ family protein [Clostridiaceae bacterium]
MRKEYKTVLRYATAEIEEKKSRFIASVKPVSTEQEALDFIQSLKTKYWDATHNVYAYYIGGDNVVQRFSDDGEPSGTAGLPVLEVIKRMELQDLAIVVTRYFGGTLLGAAGLIRAYGKSASMGIEAASVARRVLCKQMIITVEYALFGRIQSQIISKGFTIKDIIYGQDVEMMVFVPVDEVEGFSKMVVDDSSGRALVETGENTYITLDNQGKLVY